MYYYHPHTGRFEQSTRSSVRASAYGAPFVSRRSLDDDALYIPHKTYIPHHAYDTTASEYQSQSDINRELIMSTAAMEDSYDLSNRSRQRDRDVLKAANRAIVDTEVHSSPRGAVAARRAMRGVSSPPASTITKTEVHVATARASPNILRYHVPPASVPRHRPRKPRVPVRPRYRHWYPARASRYIYTAAKLAREPSPDIEGLRRAPLSILAYLRNLELALQSERYRTRSTYVPVRPAYRKAALLANKVEVNLPERRRRPRSSYAQAKIRQLRKDKRDDGEFDASTAVTLESTSGLKAHAPVYDPSHSVNKPYWDVQGLKKPNIMSWQYRLDTYVSPDDLIIVPRSLGAVRTQLRDCQDRLDRHKQLMDRYLVADKGFTVEDSLALAASKAHLGERA